MKKVMAILLVLCMGISLCACGENVTTNEETAMEQTTVAETATPTEETAEEVIGETTEEFPIAGMWMKTDEDYAYWRILDDGTMTQEFVLESASTFTVNGVTSTTSSKNIQTIPDTWELQSDNLFLKGTVLYDMVVENGDYLLKREGVSYKRIGDIDYVIPLDDTEEENPSEEAIAYVMNETLNAEGIELTLSESGIADDIRVSSSSSGIKITSGPSPEADKQFVFLKGILKYTGKQSVFPAIGGLIALDGYEYELDISLINEDGTPCSTIEPLDQVIILLYAHIPVELTQSFTDGEIKFGFNDNFENVDISDCDYLYTVDAATLKN